MRSRYAFKSSIPTVPQKIAIRERLRKKGTIKSLGKEFYTLSDPIDYLRNFINFFWKTLQYLWIDGWTKERKRKYSPYQKYYKGKRIHMKEFHPSSTKNIHTLAHLDQGLWLVSPLDPVFDLAKYEKQVCLQILHAYSSTKTAIRDRLRKKGTIKKPW